MPFLITKGVKVLVRPTYNAEHSDEAADYSVFDYTVEITNLNPFPVRLINRRWEIFDSIGVYRVVEGAGVVGEQPLLEPGQVHTYTSWVNLSSNLGEMIGAFEMQKEDGSTFWVDVPAFELATPGALN